MLHPTSAAGAHTVGDVPHRQTLVSSAPRVASLRRERALVVAASSMGTAFEWYDFFLFGTLASIIAKNFTGASDSAGFIFTLGVFAAGFLMRPFGALFFGSMGDRVGRKQTFLVTIALMGAST